MVEVNDITGAVSGTFSGLFGGIIILVIVLVVIGLIFGVGWFVHYRKKFDIIAEIYSQRASNEFSLFYDKAAILKDRDTGAKYFKLWEVKIELPVPPFNVMEKTNKGDLIRIWRKTNDEFVYITKPIINKTKILRQDGRYYQIGEEEFTQLEGDIAFWNLKRKQKNRDIFSNDSILSKLMVWLPQLMGGFFVIVILYILLNSLPGLIAALTQLAEKLNVLEAYQNVSR